MGQFYTGEPVLYPLFGLSQYDGSLCDRQGNQPVNASNPPQWVYDDPDWLDMCKRTQEESLFHFWMVRSLTIRFSVLGEIVFNSNVRDSFSQSMDFVIRRHGYPDDEITEKVATIADIPTGLDKFVSSGGHAGINNYDGDRILNRVQNHAVHRFPDGDYYQTFITSSNSYQIPPTGNYTGATIQGFWSNTGSVENGIRMVCYIGYLPTSRTGGGSNFTIGGVKPVVLELDDYRVRITAGLTIQNQGYPGVYSDQMLSPAKWEGSFEYTQDSDNRENATMTAELIDVELYEQSP